MPFNKVVRVVFWLIALSLLETLRLRAPQEEVEADAARGKAHAESAAPGSASARGLSPASNPAVTKS